jgi:hypothetical protein
VGRYPGVGTVVIQLENKGLSVVGLPTQFVEGPEKDECFNHYIPFEAFQKDKTETPKSIEGIKSAIAHGDD